MHELDTLCVRRALEGAKDLPPGASLFVNVAPQTLDRDADGDTWLADAVRSSKLDPSRVVIEVTERVGAATETVLRSIEHLRAAGLRIALDDVGVGNSGLEMLRRARPDFVKIDRTVVTESRTDPGARAVLAAIAAFASESGAYVIAEGIENDELLELVRESEGGLRRPRPAHRRRPGLSARPPRGEHARRAARARARQRPSFAAGRAPRCRRGASPRTPRARARSSASASSAAGRPVCSATRRARAAVSSSRSGAPASSTPSV